MATSTTSSKDAFSFSTCLQLLEDTFSAAFSQAFSQDPAISPSDAYFNLGAFSFNQGKRRGIFQRTAQFSESIVYINNFLRYHFPQGTWSSICISHNVRTMLHTDSGNELDSFNHTLSLGNFSGGEVWVCPALNSSAGKHPAPKDSATQEHPAGSQLLGEAVDTWHRPTTFPCSSLHCTLPWQGDRWVIAAYTCRDPLALSSMEITSLQALGFQLPVRPSFTPYPRVSAQLQHAGASPGGIEFFLDVCCGASAPPSQALAGQHVSCIRVGMLGDDPLDLSCDVTYDKLLRLAFSGCVKYAHASPPCRDYSRLKLRPGGPPAIRSPEHLDGLPGNTPQQQARVRSSQRLLYRCTCILRAVFSAGGHVSLEQPTNAMSWLESFVQSFLSKIQASLVVIPACSVGQDLAKSWLFATSFQGLQPLAAKCTHGNTHVQVAGVQDAQGHFLSQRTAEYPARLASKFCLQVAPLFSAGLKQAAWPGNPQSPSAARFCTLGFALQCIPHKPRSAPPFGAQDGGGIYSLPDWSYAPMPRTSSKRSGRSGSSGFSKSRCQLASLSMFRHTWRPRFSLRQRRHG